MGDELHTCIALEYPANRQRRTFVSVQFSYFLRAFSFSSLHTFTNKRDAEKERQKTANNELVTVMKEKTYYIFILLLG